MIRRISVLTILLSLPSLALAGHSAMVTNGNNDGDGSLRAALESGATRIKIKPSVTTITVTETLLYTGVAPLILNGTGQTIDGSGLVDNFAPILQVTEGADTKIRNLTFDAGGGNANGPYTRENQGGGKGIFIDVPAHRTGFVNMILNEVTVMGTGNHGVHISDCSLEDACGDGAGGGGDGSPASIRVRLRGVLIENNGNGKQDADGFRVDDRGDGSIYFTATRSAFIDNGADGVELDEGDSGSVFAYVRHSTFDFNGEYCLIGDFVPGDDCDDDGEADVDDAFDIDEAGNGSIYGMVWATTVINNFDEGLDFDEAGSGDVVYTVANVYSDNNEDEGVKVSEEDDGDNIVKLRNLITDGDLEFEEDGNGIVDILIRGSTVGDDMQIEADDGDPTTNDGFYEARGTTVGGDLDFEGEITIL